MQILVIQLKNKKLRSAYVEVCQATEAFSSAREHNTDQAIPPDPTHICTGAQTYNTIPSTSLPTCCMFHQPSQKHHSLGLNLLWRARIPLQAHLHFMVQTLMSTIAYMIPKPHSVFRNVRHETPELHPQSLYRRN